MRRSEERFRQFFDHAPNVTALKDRNGRYVYTNRQFEKVCRFSPGIAIGKTDEELFVPNRRLSFNHTTNRCYSMAGDRNSRKLRTRRMDPISYRGEIPGHRCFRPSLCPGRPARERK